MSATTKPQKRVIIRGKEVTRLMSSIVWQGEVGAPVYIPKRAIVKRLPEDKDGMERLLVPAWLAQDRGLPTW